MKDANAAVRLDPGDADAYITRSEIALDKGDLNLAVADADVAIRLAPLYVRVLMNCAMCLANGGRFDDAIKDINEVLRLEAFESVARKNAQ